MKRINVKTYTFIRKALMQAGQATVAELSQMPFMQGKNLRTIKYVLAEKDLGAGMSQDERDVYHSIYRSNL